ncbi:hypothetical protein XELAEV_18030586mg [Xenopus laevis]|uniref:Uncharacterized protein n=1 Tax=Xenopus laevis TaxID=8355 RepID=A0A974HEV6_XENLA|nr:hypothetical protein XELAEV_18030586mg [Xenopus laevis]
MCYRSILVMRSIPELLEGNVESTSLGVPRHLVEGSSSSSSSGSSSDNESDISPTSRDSNPSLEHHLSIFKMYDKDKFQEMHQKTDDITQEERSQEVSLVYSDQLEALENQTDEKVGLGEVTKKLEEKDKMLVDSVETSPGKRPFCKAATIEVGDLGSKKGKSGCFVRGSSADSALLGVNKHTLVCVPRQSIINSTFYSQSGEGAGLTPRDGALRDKEFIKHREKARRSLMKAGYSQKILSGLREPLLEQFALEQRILAQDKTQATQEGHTGSLKKSVSFDGSKGLLRSSFKASSRSRSLDDCKSRPLTVYKGVLLEEVGQNVSAGANVDDKHLDTNIRCHSEEGVIAADISQGLTDSTRRKVKQEEPHAAKEHSTPLFISSTQRPLSATSVDSENAIIAVLHQRPLFDSGSVKERPPSVALGVEESTVIAFVQQTPLPSKTPENMKDSYAPQTTVLPSQFEGPTPHLGGSVTFTVKTTSDTNCFLVSQPQVEKCQVGCEVDTEKSIKQESGVSPDSMECIPYVVHFTDPKSSITIIQQGLQNDTSLLKATEHSTKECALETVTEATVVTEKVEEKSSITSLFHFSPKNPDLSTQCGDGIHKPSISEHQELGSTSERHSDITNKVSSQNIDKHLRSSLYSDEQCAALEDLVGEMTYLSEQMNVLADNQGQISKKKSIAGKTQAEGCPPATSLAMETEVTIIQTSLSPQEAKEPQVTSVSQCSFYDSLSPVQSSPLPHEQFEEFTIESCSSSKTFISHSDSSETGRRSDNFSDFEEAGRHSEVSLLEIEELNYDSPSTSSVGPFKFETAQSHLLDFYGINESPQNSEDLSQEKSLLDNEKLNLSLLNSQPLLGGNHDMKSDVLERTIDPTKAKVSKNEESSSTASTKDKKRSSSRKRIKLFRPHSKTDSSGKSSDQSLKQKVKASVANFSRIIKGKPSNGQERKEGEA